MITNSSKVMFFRNDSFYEKQNALDEILSYVCEEIQITPTQHQDAKAKYTAVGEWLSDCPNISQFNPQIYAQGSINLETTVKPRNKEEFDIDLVCLVDIPKNMFSSITPRQLYNLIKARINENLLYKNKTEEYKRCIRINYANQFHMDITPAMIDHSRGGTCILVPDRKLEQWVSCDPKSYKTWFDKKSLQKILLERRDYSIETIPALQRAEHKPTLQRTIQLIKRNRDVVFKGEDTAPKSIILTTLTAMNYEGQVSCINSLEQATNKICNIISAANGKQITVANPVNQNEILSDAWSQKPALYQIFKEFIFSLQTKINKLKEVSGMDSIQKEIGSIFDEKIVSNAINKYNRLLLEANEKNNLHINRNTLGLTVAAGSNIPIPKHNFYGK